MCAYIYKGRRPGAGDCLHFAGGRPPLPSPAVKGDGPAPLAVAVVACSEKKVTKTQVSLCRCGMDTGKDMCVGDYVKFTASAEKVQHLFNVTLHEKAFAGHKVLGAAAAVPVPQSLADAVESIGGLHFERDVFRAPRRRPSRRRQARGSSSRSEAPACLNDTPISAACIREYYGVTKVFARSSNNSQAVAEFAGNSFAPDDLKAFLSSQHLPAQTLKGIVGPNQPSSPSIEASLDVQWIVATGSGANTYSFSTSGSTATPFLDWVVLIGDDPHTPLVHAVSYGTHEEEYPTACMASCPQ